MDTDRRERAKSIRAARDWLRGAENALAGEDDLAGDLKLMLARAELARLAADRRTRLRRSALRLLPPLTAAAFIAGYFLWEQPPPAKTAVPSPVQRAEQRMEAPAAPVQESVSSTGQEAVTVPPIETHGQTDAPEERVQPMQTAAPPSEPVPHAALPRMPSADMQRLMQVGGKILRE